MSVNKLRPQDFIPGEIVIYNDEIYSYASMKYKIVRKRVKVVEYDNLGVRIEINKGENPDYNLWVGSHCLDLLLEKITDDNYNVIPFRRKNI